MIIEKADLATTELTTLNNLHSEHQGDTGKSFLVIIC